LLEVGVAELCVVELPAGEEAAGLEEVGVETLLPAGVEEPVVAGGVLVRAMVEPPLVLIGVEVAPVSVEPPVADTTVVPGVTPTQEELLDDRIEKGAEYCGLPCESLIWRVT